MITDLGSNAGIVEDMYREYVEHPESVSAAWREFFADYVPREASAPTAPAPATTRSAPPSAAPAPPPATAAAPPAPAPTSAPSPSSTPVAAGAPVVLDGETPAILRGAAARIVSNMEASLGVPTATSVRTVPAKLLEINRQILNNQLARSGGGKVSFTHIIGFAVLRALRDVPAMNSGFGVTDGKPSVVRHQHVNLGIAIDLSKSDGTRTLLVPNIKGADTLDFFQFHTAYEDVLRRVRDNKITVDDFAGTTVSITNPGVIGTEHSVPRLMPGQGLIVGVGSIAYPPEYEGADPHTIARVAVSKVVTLTSTYDHRVIQGAESGEFLAAVHDYLLGEHGFYDAMFQSFSIPYEPARWSRDRSPLDDEQGWAEKALKVQQLINIYRVRGHLISNLDPLGRKEPKTHEELDPMHWGLTIWDLDREFPTGGLAGKRTMPLRDILGLLRDAYARTVGVEYMHIQEVDQKNWIQDHVEGVQNDITRDEREAILTALNAAEAFERFLHTKYLGQKRFSLEGSETLIPMLDFLLDSAVDDGMQEAVIGMSHRGRLNVLTNIVGKAYAQVFREFEGELDPNVPGGSGDVKYHLGATGKYEGRDGGSIAVTLAANPSHLEAVDPVVEGIVRAKQDRLGDQDRRLVLPVLIHGDAAFAGQGVVAETLNLSELPGYDVGGTVHIVVNNQLGFTTAPDFARSTVYATDIAKAVQAPIFHVNGDDPEAACRVIELAYAFRQAFAKDVVVDLVCYRRYGHNEGDEPAFTQPRMYELIENRRSVRKIYTETLVNRGDLTLPECERTLEDYRARLEAAFESTHDSKPPSAPVFDTGSPRPATPEPAVATAVALERLRPIVAALSTFPESFTPHPKLARLFAQQTKGFDDGHVDWALGEALAFGTLLESGTPVRVAGQDTRRGTFSQRHAVLVDFNDEHEYTPLAHIASADGEGPEAPYMIYDSVLSEFAALGFEYGYSVAAPDTLVCWEAQFGDFANGGQTIIDQFIVAAHDKWGQQSGLVLLLPHGFEGQGPEHSSARLERFLTLCAEDNLRVVYPTTAAQYFHVLRRQVLAPRRRPLVVLTPKRYLRMPATRSPVAELTDGSFHETLVDDGGADAASVTRIVACTGKIGHELIAKRDELGATAAVVRVEQLYPVADRDFAEIVARYGSLREIVWVQEEPENMGARIFALPLLKELAGDGIRISWVARKASASPASGSSKVHDVEQQHILEAAFAPLESPATF
jgi:2-oxoglutarate dehydrogenase E1 component